MPPTPLCHVARLGTVDYATAWELQKTLAFQVREGARPNTLLLLQHPPVYTIGRRGTRAQVLLDDDGLAKLGVSLWEVDRGGEVTYHGPGQLVGYPIVDLRQWGGPLKYVRTLEQVMIKTLAHFQVQAGVAEGLTGVWVGEEKIGAIGVRISGGVACHGFALNVNTDLSYYQPIIPCGITDKGVTSMKRLLGQEADLDAVAYCLVYHFGAEMGLRMVEVESSVEALASLSPSPC